MRSALSRTSDGCSSDEAVKVLNDLLKALYLPNENGEYAASSREEAEALLYKTQPAMYGFAKNLVNHFEEDEALALLAEIDHRLDIPDDDFKFDYSVPNCGSSEEPYQLTITYGDESLGFVKIVVSKMICN